MIAIMETPNERILLVESDPEKSDLIARQTLQSIGYRVRVVRSATEGLKAVEEFIPDILITNLELPDLSGKDLLVALNAQGFEAPIIIISPKTQEGDLMQAFRLGAADVLQWPVREAEIVAAVERVMKQVRARQEREHLARQLKQTNDELQQRIRELMTIFAIGKAVTSITNQGELLEKIVEGAMYVCEADCGWLLLRQDDSKALYLAAQRNLPNAMAVKLKQLWDDGVSSLVVMSGEALSIAGEPLARFKLAQIGQSALLAPVKLKRDVVGILTVMRKASQPFPSAKRPLLEAVADYASISLANARLFKALEERASSLQAAMEVAQASVHMKDEQAINLKANLEGPLSEVMKTIDNLLVGETSRLNASQRDMLRAAQENVQRVFNIIHVQSEKV